jgi:S1-C subfamily serine protease
MTDKNTPLTALSNAMAEAVARVGEATVLVNARRRFPATGIVFAPDLILTADHVVQREEDITVIIPDGSELSATIAGRDPGNDLALLKLEKEAASPAVVSEDAPKIGQLALALGRPTTEGIQASLGIVSAIGGPVRTRRGGLVDGFIRTDAIPYPGFSGGPLIDAAGQVIGINTSGLGHGASIAIPVKIAWRIAASLAEFGSVKRGFLGIRSQPAELSEEIQAALKRDQRTGLLIVGVEEDSPAKSGGLIVGDILVAINGSPVEDHDELFGRLTGDIVGHPTPFEVLRGGNPLVVTVTVGERVEASRNRWRQRRGHKRSHRRKHPRRHG